MIYGNRLARGDFLLLYNIVKKSMWKEVENRSMPDVQTVQQIAQSQYVFSILFVFLFFAVIGAVIWLFNNLHKETIMVF